MKILRLEIARYAANGVVATVAHYITLYLSLEVYGLGSAGLANLCASFVGVGCSFLGNRFIVFRSTHRKIIDQFLKFVSLYVIVALIHGGLLYLWSDILGKDYNHGFAIAVVIQFVLGYAVSKRIVFKKSTEIIEGRVKT